MATGIFNTGTNIGAIFAPLLVPLIVLNFNWQAAFIMLGVTDLVWLGFWLESLQRAGKIPAGQPGGTGAHSREGWRRRRSKKFRGCKLLGYREAWAYYGTCVLVGPVWWFYGFWLPDFFNKQFHLDLKQFGLPLVVVYAVTALGSIGGGSLSAWFLKRGWPVNRARKSASLLCALLHAAGDFRAARRTACGWRRLFLRWPPRRIRAGRPRCIRSCRTSFPKPRRGVGGRFRRHAGVVDVHGFFLARRPHVAGRRHLS